MMRKEAISTSGEAYYRRVETGFDNLASSYDTDIAGNEITIRMREIFRRVLLDAFHPGERLVEIGCGTGIDAVWLAEQGLEVVATDISQGMVDRVAEKARAMSLKSLICRKLAAKDIGLLGQEFGFESFDGAYSHAGALNIEPELARVPAQLRPLLRESCPFVSSVINRTSLFEVVFYLSVLRPRKAFRRLGHPVPIPISRSGPLQRYVVPSRFYTPRETRRLFEEHFVLNRLHAMELFVPPANLTREYSLLKPIFAPLEVLETQLSARRPWNQWGHHTIFTFRARESPPRTPIIALTNSRLRLKLESRKPEPGLRRREALGIR